MIGLLKINIMSNYIHCANPIKYDVTKVTSYIRSEYP